MYTYNAKVLSVYDGDTIRVDIDLGFGFSNKGSTGRGMSLRLFGINAPEMRGVEKIEGKKSRDFLRNLILDKTVTIKTIKDKTGKYGRYLAKVYIDNLYINEELVNNNMAIWKNY